jgi:hypothetical protein
MSSATYYVAPTCRCCGKREQRKVGRLAWRCSRTGQTWYYRVTSDGFVPLAREVALAIDEERSQ